MKNEFKKEALRITKEHYHIGVKDLDVANKCAIVTVKNIISETLKEYTNDENHDRVSFYNKVLTELDHLFDIKNDEGITHEY